jgi:dinuclear metal center YbgI/SA1388 family protein
MQLKEMLDYTGQLLQVDRYRDYCPNGLQVEGQSEIKKIVTGVSANQALLEAAAEAGAEMILVHHGYFWKGEPANVVGIKRSRLKYLLERNISLVAYHLPLDGHPELGNNAQLGKMLGLEIQGWCGEQSLIAYGRTRDVMTLQSFEAHIAQVLNRKPLVIRGSKKKIHRVAWCSGAAQDGLLEAIELGVDVFITGEVSERTVHLAKESGVTFVAAGHHATERYGIQALGVHLAGRFDIEHSFVEIDNPV